MAESRTDLKARDELELRRQYSAQDVDETRRIMRAVDAGKTPEAPIEGQPSWFSIGWSKVKSMVSSDPEYQKREQAYRDRMRERMTAWDTLGDVIDVASGVALAVAVVASGGALSGPSVAAAAGRGALKRAIIGGAKRFFTGETGKALVSGTVRLFSREGAKDALIGGAKLLTVRPAKWLLTTPKGLGSLAVVGGKTYYDHEVDSNNNEANQKQFNRLVDTVKQHPEASLPTMMRYTRDVKFGARNTNAEQHKGSAGNTVLQNDIKAPGHATSPIPSALSKGKTANEVKREPVTNKSALQSTRQSGTSSTASKQNGGNLPVRAKPSDNVRKPQQEGVGAGLLNLPAAPKNDQQSKNNINHHLTNLAKIDLSVLSIGENSGKTQTGNHHKLT